MRAERAESVVDHVERSVERGRRWIAAQLDELREEKLGLIGELGMGVRGAEGEEEGEKTVLGGTHGGKGDEVGERTSECRIGDTEQERVEDRRGD